MPVIQTAIQLLLSVEVFVEVESEEKALSDEQKDILLEEAGERAEEIIKLLISRSDDVELTDIQFEDSQII